jgi:hypothetical protein
MSDETDVTQTEQDVQMERSKIFKLFEKWLLRYHDLGSFINDAKDIKRSPANFIRKTNMSSKDYHAYVHRIIEQTSRIWFDIYPIINDFIRNHINELKIFNTKVSDGTGMELVTMLKNHAEEFLSSIF